MGQGLGASKAAHPDLFGGLVAVEYYRLFAETERAMFLEGRHPGHHALVIEMGHRPFHRFLHLGATGVHDFAQMFQDWFGEIGRFGDICVDSMIFAAHKLEISRMFAEDHITRPQNFLSSGNAGIYNLKII